MRLFVKLISAFSLSFNSYASLPSHEAEALKQLVAAQNGSKTALEFVEKYKRDLQPADFEFLKGKAKEMGKEALPKVQMKGDDTIVITTPKAVVSFQVLSLQKAKFRLNNRALDLEGKSISERWDLMMKALPEDGEKSALWDFFFPKAEAGAIGPIIGWGLVILGPIIAGAFGLNQSQCKELTETIDACYLQKSNMMDFSARMNYKLAQAEKRKADKDREKAAKKAKHAKAVAEAKRKGKKPPEPPEEDEDDEKDDDSDEAKALKTWREFQDHKKKGECLPFSVDAELDEKVHEAISAVKAVSQQPTAELARCWTGKKYPSEDGVFPSAVLKRCEKPIYTMTPPEIISCKSTVLYWPDMGSGSRNELLKKCAKSLYDMAKDMCLRRAVDTYERHWPPSETQSDTTK